MVFVWVVHVPFAVGWTYILEKHGGRLPLRIKAVPEGTVVPTRNGMSARPFIATSTCPEQSVASFARVPSSSIGHIGELDVIIVYILPQLKGKALKIEIFHRGESVLHSIDQMKGESADSSHSCTVVL